MKDLLERLKELDIETFERIEHLPIPPGLHHYEAYYQTPEGERKSILPYNGGLLLTRDMPESIVEAWVIYCIMRALINLRWGFKIESRPTMMPPLHTEQMIKTEPNETIFGDCSLWTAKSLLELYIAALEAQG